MVTNCNELNFKAGTELAHKCKSYRLRPCSHCTDRLSERPENRIGQAFCSHLTPPVKHNSCDDFELERSDSKNDTFRIGYLSGMLRS